MYPNCALFPEINKQAASVKQNEIGPAKSVSLNKYSGSSAKPFAWNGFKTASDFSNIRAGYISSSSNNGGSSNSLVAAYSWPPGIDIGSGVKILGCAPYPGAAGYWFGSYCDWSNDWKSEI